MKEHIILDDFFPLQADLDANIANLHSVTYESTFDRRLLALLVELGEFANETRCFKYWSLKPGSPKEIVLDEYADGMHFFLSLGVALGIKHLDHEFDPKFEDLSKAIVNVYEKVALMHSHYDEEHYLDAFSSFLDIIPMLGFTAEDARGAYLSKLGVNYKRQENHY